MAAELHSLLAFPGPLQVQQLVDLDGYLAAIWRLLCSSCQVTLGRAQPVDLGLHLPGGPRVSTPGGQLQTMPGHHLTTSMNNTLKGQTQQVPELHWSKFCSVGLATAQQLRCSHGWSLYLISLQANPSHWCANSNQSSTTTEGCTQPIWKEHRKHLLRCLGRLCHWTLQDTHYIRSPYQDWKTANLPNTWKNTEKQPKWGDKHVPTERKETSPEKELNKMEESKLPDAEFKTMVIRRPKKT